MRQGLGASARSALFGGVLLALIEGAGIMLNKVLSGPQNMPIIMEEPVPSMAGGPGFPPGLPSQLDQGLESSSSQSDSGWFGGIFSGGKKKETPATSGSKTEILESFDAPPVPNFEYK